MVARPALAPFPLRVGVLARGVGIGVVVGAAAGLSSALFLTLLENVTEIRTADPRWVWALPLAGLAIGAFWQRWGAPIRGGADLILDTMHDDGPRLPLRMAPMVLVGSVLTHLFGGSAGREGTAVQMGASLADAFGHRFGFDQGNFAATCWRPEWPAASERSSARRSRALSSASRCGRPDALISARSCLPFRPR